MNIIELQKLPDYELGMTDAQVAELKKGYANLDYIDYNCELCLENDCSDCGEFEFELEDEVEIELEDEVD
jgi:hypothetical protein